MKWIYPSFTLFFKTSSANSERSAGAYDVGSRVGWQVWERVSGANTLEGDSLLQKRNISILL